MKKLRLISLVLFGALLAGLLLASPLGFSKPGEKPVPAETREPFVLCSTYAEPNVFHVPEGKRLVVEFVTAYAAVGDNGPSTHFSPAINACTNGQYALHWVSVARLCDPDPDGDNRIHYAATHLVRIYADPGSSISWAWAGNWVPETEFQLTISGYLEDAP